MCVTFLALADDDDNKQQNQRPLGKYKLILLNNRDEVFDRATSALSWRYGILGGWDDREDGTWLGIDGAGRIGVLHSITQPPNSLDKSAPSRGGLVKEFLRSRLTPREFLTSLGPRAHKFNGFQFLGLHRTPTNGTFELVSMCNRISPVLEPVFWKSDIYGFSNSPREHQFRKADYGERLFRQFLDQFDLQNGDEKALVDGLFSIASDRTEHFPDEQIRQQSGCPPGSDLYKFFCSIFVDGTWQGRAYGTRSSSVLLVDAAGAVAFHERRMLDPAKPMDDPAKWAFSVQRFKLDNN